jgi:4-hydroxy-2-oxoheptanedioate aldolase
MIKSLKKRMLDGESVFGTWCMLPSSFVADVISSTKIDFLIIDMEHGTMTFETAEDMVRAAQLKNCQPIIRVGDSHENTILHALETGCGAVMVPHVSTSEVAKKIANASRYAPLGNRGLSPYTRCHDYTHENLSESLIKHAEETLVGILVEGNEGIKNLPEIAKVDGIDFIYLGMYDISQSIGLPGELENPKVLAQLNRCLKIIKDAGKLAGTFSRDIEACRTFKKMGFEFIAYLADSNAIRTFYLNAIKQYKK